MVKINIGGSNSINNFETTINGPQVIGRLNTGDSRKGEIALILQQLETTLEQLKSDTADSSADASRALHAVEEMRRELASKSPKADILDRSLKAIDGISSIASLVGQIRALLPNLF